jgi:glycosyltransferase involved in cell wall biosynthesis
MMPSLPRSAALRSAVEFPVAVSGSRYEEQLEPVEGPDGVSLIIPAWNEEARLPIALERYLPLLESYGRPFEVLVIVDGVADRTAEVARIFESRGVRAIEFEDRLGKGGAVMEGFRRAKFDLVGFIDADAPITAVSMAYLLAELTTAEGAIASRWDNRSNRDLYPRFSRRVFSKSWNLLVRVVLGLKLKDTQCGAKFFRRQAVMSILPKVFLTNWAFDASLLFHFERAGFRVVEVPVNWSADPSTKLNLSRTIPAMFLSLIGIRMMNDPRLARPTRAIAHWFYTHLG